MSATPVDELNDRLEAMAAGGAAVGAAPARSPTSTSLPNTAAAAADSPASDTGSVARTNALASIAAVLRDYQPRPSAASERRTLVAFQRLERSQRASRAGRRSLWSAWLATRGSSAPPPYASNLREGTEHPPAHRPGEWRVLRVLAVVTALVALLVASPVVSEAAPGSPMFALRRAAEVATHLVQNEIVSPLASLVSQATRQLGWPETATRAGDPLDPAGQPGANSGSQDTAADLAERPADQADLRPGSGDGPAAIVGGPPPNVPTAVAMRAATVMARAVVSQAGLPAATASSTSSSLPAPTGPPSEVWLPAPTDSPRASAPSATSVNTLVPHETASPHQTPVSPAPPASSPTLAPPLPATVTPEPPLPPVSTPLLPSPPVPPQPSPGPRPTGDPTYCEGRITGTVRRSDGGALQGATVRFVVAPPAAQPETIAAASDGQYVAAKMCSGDYGVVAAMVDELDRLWIGDYDADGDGKADPVHIDPLEPEQHGVDVLMRLR